MRALILTLTYPSRASYYDDWLDAFVESTHFETEILNIFSKQAVKTLQKRIDEFDFVIMLHACSSDTLLYLHPLKSVLQDRKSKVIAFIGNEYNHPGMFLSEKAKFFKDINAEYIVSQLPLEAAEWVYGETGAQVIELPHGLNPNIFRPGEKLCHRPIEIGFRSFRYPAFLGDNDRNRLADLFLNMKNLKIDFSHQNRLPREEWSQFLSNSKAVIGTEAGSYYLQKDDSIVKKIRDYVLSQEKGVVLSSHTPFRKIISALPYGLKNSLKRFLRSGPFKSEVLLYENLDFQDIYDRFFVHEQKCPYHSKAISSRHFDAIGTKTAQILIEGKYNGILEPHTHYLSLKSDFSNLSEVMNAFSDLEYCQKIADLTYEYVYESHKLSDRLSQLARLVGSNTQLNVL